MTSSESGSFSSSTPLPPSSAAAPSTEAAPPQTAPARGKTASQSRKRGSSLSEADEYMFLKSVKSNKNFKWASEKARWAAEGTKKMVGKTFLVLSFLTMANIFHQLTLRVSDLYDRGWARCAFPCFW